MSVFPIVFFKYLGFSVNHSDLQQRIPNELLSELATNLAEGPIFQIVQSLTEVQQANEKKVFRERLELLKKHSRKLNKKM